jgi:hypothetical protein
MMLHWGIVPHGGGGSQLFVIRYSSKHWRRSAVLLPGGLLVIRDRFTTKATKVTKEEAGMILCWSEQGGDPPVLAECWILDEAEKISHAKARRREARTRTEMLNELRPQACRPHQRQPHLKILVLKISNATPEPETPVNLAHNGERDPRFTQRPCRMRRSGRRSGWASTCSHFWPHYE